MANDRAVRRIGCYPFGAAVGPPLRLAERRHRGRVGTERFGERESALAKQTDHVLREQLGAKAQARSGEFSWQQSADAMRAVLESVHAGRIVSGVIST